MIRRSVINRGGVAVSLSLLLSPAHPALAQAVWQNAPGTRADTGGANGWVATIPFAEDRVVLLGKTDDEIVSVGVLRRRDDVFHRRIQTAVANVLGDGAGKQQRLLQYEAELVAQRLERDLPQVHTVEQHTSGDRIVKPWNQADERRLPGAGLADDGNHLTGVRLE